MIERIGSYDISGLLGEGGMGVVYLGVQPHLGRRVAIKALAVELTRQPGFKERFMAEARAQALLHHPNIVTIYDLIEDGGGYFIVMEYVRGASLEGMLRERQGAALEVGPALALFRQMLAGLDYAHSRGVIHRDVKPANVLVDEARCLKLTDFGIALLIGDKRLTSSQSTVGTPVYMSPEQILRPREVDHRTDVYSAAIVLYEMLAGRPPFDGPTEYAIKKLQVESSLPDLREQRPDVPVCVAEAIAVALRKEPGDRFSSAGEFLRALDGVAVVTPAPPPLVSLPEELPSRVVAELRPAATPASSRQPRVAPRHWAGMPGIAAVTAAAILALGMAWLALGRHPPGLAPVSPGNPRAASPAGPARSGAVPAQRSSVGAVVGAGVEPRKETEARVPMPSGPARPVAAATGRAAPAAPRLAPEVRADNRRASSPSVAAPPRLSAPPASVPALSASQRLDLETRRQRLGAGIQELNDLLALRKYDAVEQRQQVLLAQAADYPAELDKEIRALRAFGHAVEVARAASSVTPNSPVAPTAEGEHPSAAPASRQAAIEILRGEPKEHYRLGLQFAGDVSHRSKAGDSVAIHFRVAVVSVVTGEVISLAVTGPVLEGPGAVRTAPETVTLLIQDGGGVREFNRTLAIPPNTPPGSYQVKVFAEVSGTAARVVATAALQVY